MFGPNSKRIINQNISSSHRSDEFQSLYKDLTQAFKEAFNLKGYHVLFINGSGTVGIESVIRSTVFDLETIGHEGRFKSRWQQLCDLYKKNRPRKESISCLLETSVSKFFEKGSLVVDAVSAFPFKPIPKEASIFVTSSNKLLGSVSGLSIVCIKDLSLIQIDNSFSYLNLFMHLQAADKNQTLTTASEAAWKDLYDCVRKHDPNKLQSKIETNSNLICDSIGRENVIGEYVCPVITIPKKNIRPTIQEKYELYDGGDNWHIFTYSEKDEDYSKLCKDLKS